MATIDIIILVFLGICIFAGAKNGVIRQLGGIVGLFLGIYLAYEFSSDVSGYLSGWLKTSDTVTKVISFTLIVLFTLILMSLSGRLIESLFAAASIGWLNRLMGVILSVAIGLFLSGIILYVVRYIDKSWFSILGESGFSDSRLADPILSVIDKVFPYLKNIF